MAFVTHEAGGGIGTLIYCPNCGKDYRLPSDKREEMRELDVAQADCARCLSPMDPAKAKIYGEEQAKKAHDPALTVIGNRMRSFAQAPEDRQVKTPVASK